MADYDVIVLGGGPAGYSAALKAAELGANVALIEAEQPGGACVHHACIPTDILLDAATKFVEARELAVLGVFGAGERFNFARAAARKDVLVGRLADGIRTALRMRGVTTIRGRGAFVSPHAVTVSSADGERQLTAEALVIATGTRWEPPRIPGVPAECILTADAVQGLFEAPKSAIVLGGGPCEVDFGLEYATLLAIAGSEVAFATAQPRILPALDATLADAARAAYSDLGISLLEGVTSLGGEGSTVQVEHGGKTTLVPAEVIVAADVRRPYSGTLNLAAAGVSTNDAISIDRSCRTNVPHIFAAGDVTGGLMLSSAASHMGEVAGANAAGGDARTTLNMVPRILHGPTEVAWVGKSEETARADGYDVATGLFDLSFNARAVALGARTGIVKVIGDRELGAILGVHVVGPEAAEVVTLAGGLMQAEATVHDLAAMVAWHPTLAEGLIEAAKRAVV